MSHPIARILGFRATQSPAAENIIQLPKLALPMTPKFLPSKPEGIPQSLREHLYWLVADCSGRPVRRPGFGDSKTNPDHWNDFATASNVAESEPGLYPYIVLTDDSLFTIFDVDFKPRRETGKDPETPAQYEARIQRAEHALELLRENFPVRYESRSKSGKGFHIIVHGKFDGSGGKGRGEWEDVEIYTREHGLVLTGHVSEGHNDPVPYFPDTIQSIRDTIKGTAPTLDSGEDMPDRKSNGSVPVEWAREVLTELARLHPRPPYPDWRDITSAVFDGVGIETGIKLLKEIWPEEKPGEYRKLAKLKWFASWGTLNGFLKGSEMRAENLVEFMPDLTEMEDGQAKPARKRLADYLVNHSDTLGMSWQEIDALRPPIIIDGFLRWGEVLLLGAESKSRKSWLTQDAGFAVAAGLPWLADENGAHGFTTAQARVHVFDLELNPAEMRYRFAKARNNRFAESPDEAAAMTSRIAAYSFDGQNFSEIMQRLEELKTTVEPGDLVIVDCLYRLCPDGNEVGPLAAILETLKRFASETRAGVILVDHFRKAGDDKARNRFAGSFVKQASASTLVAIEVTAADVLVLNIDARTFHGCNKVHARFNPETYAFTACPRSRWRRRSRRADAASRKGGFSNYGKAAPWNPP